MNANSIINKYKVKLNNNLHFKEILYGSANTIVLKVIGMLLGLAVTLFISKKYGAEGIGLYNLSIRTIALFAIFATLGFGTSILRYVGQFNKKGSEYKLKLLFRHSVQIVLPFSAVLGILLFLTSDLIANGLFHNIKYKEPFRILSLAIPFLAILNISVQFIRGLKSIKISEFLRTISRPAFNIILLISIGSFIHHYLLPIITFTIALSLTTIISVSYIYYRLHSIQNSSKISFTKNELLKTSFPMLIILIMGFLQVNISIYFLEVYTSTDQVGIFSVSLKLASLISLVLMSVNTISAPKYSELYWSNQQKELQKVVFYSSKLIFIISVLVAAIIIIFLKPILNIFGSEFAQGKIVLLVLILGQIVNSLSGSVGFLLTMTGNQKILSNIILLVLPINILLSIIFIPMLGIFGAAIVNMIAVSFVNIICVIFVYKRLAILTLYIPFLSVKIINNLLKK